uniref:Very-long-chain (3R)-3-hydroxyacyl-CoA dehydratase n=1 Tax=Aegilops tauschii TaxID=37682 RepID=M8CA66_AEGTA
MEGNVGPVVRRLYLSVYNWAAFFGWAQVLCYATLALLERKPEAIYTAIEQPLLVTQTAALMEVIRYPYYGMKETFGFAHFWLLWLRYNMFLILYPIGMLSEVGLIYVTLPYMKASNKYCLQMPNKWNFSFNYHYASVLLMGIYFPGFPHLFHYMLIRRKVVLSKAKAA